MNDRAALGQLAAAVLLLGAGWPITKLALLDGASSSWFALGRAALSGVAMAACAGLMGQVRLPGRADMPGLLVLGVLQLGMFFVLAHAGASVLEAGRTAILANATLVWTVPITLLVTRERIGPRRAAAALLSFAGVLVLAGPWAVDWRSPAVLWGHAALLGAALSWAVAMAVLRVRPPRLSTFQLLPWAFGIAVLVMLPMTAVHEVGRWSGRGLLGLLVIGLLTGPAGTWCIAQATTRLPLVLVSVGFLAGPAIGLLLSAAFLGEALTPPLLLGAALLLGSAVLAATGAPRA